MPNIKVQRVCKYEHGALELLLGDFALTGVVVHRSAAGLLGQASRQLVASDVGYALKVWRCPECGYVELVDDEDL